MKYENVLEEVKKDDYFVISINYEKINGIRIFKTLEDYKNNFDENFYLLYIFNKKRMYKMVNDNYNGKEISKIVVEKEEDNYDFYTRKYYLEEKGKIEITYFVDKFGNEKSYFSNVEV